MNITNLETSKVKAEKIKSMAHLILTDDDNGAEVLKIIKSNINYTHGNVENIFVNYELPDILIDELIKKLKNFDKIVVSTLVKIRMNKGESTINSTHLKLIMIHFILVSQPISDILLHYKRQTFIYLFIFLSHFLEFLFFEAMSEHGH